MTTAPSPRPGCLPNRPTPWQRGGPTAVQRQRPLPGAGKFDAYTHGLLRPGDSVPRAPALPLSADLARRHPAAVPFPDTQTIEYPDAVWWRYISEKRIKKYGKAVDLFDRDDKTKQILEKLDEPISMSFAEETPLEDVLKYIKQATTTATYRAFRFYVDPLGLQEAEQVA